jgi:hypothetical protein
MSITQIEKVLYTAKTHTTSWGRLGAEPPGKVRKGALDCGPSSYLMKAARSFATLAFVIASISSVSCAGLRNTCCQRAHDAKPERHRHQIRERVGPHLFHDIAAMCLHRDLADAEFPAHLLV